MFKTKSKKEEPIIISPSFQLPIILIALSFMLLFLTIILCLLLGMGLPTTANYVVVASLMDVLLTQILFGWFYV